MKKNERLWNENDILFLKENYKKMGANYCSEKLNRTLLAVFKRAKMVGVTSTKGRWFVDAESFAEVIKKSNSLKEVILSLNLRYAGGNHLTIKKYIEEYKLDTSHFITRQEYAKKMGERFRKRPIEYYLVDNNTTTTGNGIKNRLFKEGLLERKCVLCGQEELWMGKRMSLILDHKNGNHYDWRIENLRIVCPNCNATLDTHCKKNLSKRTIKLRELGLDENVKVDLRKDNKGKIGSRVISNELKLSRKNNRKVDRPDYETLKKQINESNYSAVGRLYGVSDNAIRKWIKAYEKELLMFP